MLLHLHNIHQHALHPFRQAGMRLSEPWCGNAARSSMHGHSHHHGHDRARYLILRLLRGHGRGHCLHHPQKEVPHPHRPQPHQASDTPLPHQTKTTLYRLRLLQKHRQWIKASYPPVLAENRADNRSVARLSFQVSHLPLRLLCLKWQCT